MRRDRGVGRAEPANPPGRAWSRLGLAAILGLTTACATGRNWIEPTAPRYGGRPASVSARRPPAQLRIVTFNLNHAHRLDSALAILREDPALRGADVIALQEVDEHAVARVAALGRYWWVYYPATVHPSTGRNFGPAILSRWPIVADGKVILPHRAWNRGTQRIATRATIDVGGHRILVYSAHIAPIFEVFPWGQEAQVNAILDDADESALPVIVAGDLNDEGLGLVLEDRGFAWPTRDIGATHLGLLSLDHIFVRGLAPPPRAGAGKVSRGRSASDHLPVWALVGTSTSGGPDRVRTSTRASDCPGRQHRSLHDTEARRHGTPGARTECSGRFRVFVFPCRAVCPGALHATSLAPYLRGRHLTLGLPPAALERFLRYLCMLR